MTQEEKAKAYNEALEQAKKELAACGSIDCDAARLIFRLFPQLNEDERIRKEIIEYLTVTRERDLVGHPERQRWITYLEKQKEYHIPWYDYQKSKEAGYTIVPNEEYEQLIKQKEQKPVQSNVEKEYIRTIKSLISDFIRGKHEIDTEYYQKIYDWLDGRHIEQKPAEWSEDWREEDIQTRFAFYTYKDEDGVLYLSNVFVEEASRNHGFGTKILIAAEKVAETIGATTISLKVKQDSPANAWYRKNGYGYVTFEDGYDWLEKNLEYMKPNKQEWGEEDDWKRKELIQYLEEKGDYRTFWITWLKSLRPQPQQNMSIGFMLYLDEHRPDGKMCLSNAECNEIETAFKNQSWETILRYAEKYQPHWKPSEEQMEALKSAVKLYKSTHFENNHEKIVSLYEQLKKL